MSVITPPKPARTHVAYEPSTLTVPRSRVRYALATLFGVYLAILIWTVLWELEIPWIGHASERTLKLLPYIATGSAGANQPSEVMLNIALFIPFGIYLRYLAPNWSGVWHLSIIAGTSLSFEAIQYLLAIGATDTADVINNTLGGLIGVALCPYILRLFRRQNDVLLLRIMLIGTVVVLVLITVYMFGSQLHQSGTHMPLPLSR
ncbi:VanZ family protein [Leucobacter coleopterorum]|uniref:VanZ family protein n=1 Tax=Leucobacter coleopterorum TaxID=2714933 RepID=A0ABX6JWU9_9MICO|nr:VanZ family protein [Leucobacter coleopterorum]QIM18778.1 VanZ family protein [Leucobacter coleopterorum]